MESGDSQKNKKDTTIRIVTHNINRMPLNKNRPKNKSIWKAIQGRDQTEIHLLQEIGINWSKIEKNNNLYSREKYIKGRKAILSAHNSRDRSNDLVQFGGVMITANGIPVSWISDKGRDKKG